MIDNIFDFQQFALMAKYAYPAKCVDGYRGVIEDATLIECKETDTQLYTFKIYDSLYFVFRGTELKARDLITDIMAFKRHVKYINVDRRIRAHAGVLRAYTSVSDDIQSIVKHSSREKIKLIGHSLGGGLAQHAGFDTSDDFSDRIINVATFGAPKIGNRHFKKMYNKRVPFSYDFENLRDGVPKVPIFASKAGNRIKMKSTHHDVDEYISGLYNPVYIPYVMKQVNRINKKNA